MPGSRPPSRRPARLPARVYWFRRALVLGSAVGLVVAFAHLLGGGGGQEPAKAEVVSSQPTPSTAPQPYGPMPLGAAAGAAGTVATPQAQPQNLAQPSGPCNVQDVTVTPVTGTAAAGAVVPLGLQLSGISPACTFVVSPTSIVVKVSKGAEKVWSSQDCPGSIARATVVVRSATATTVQVNWSGRASDSSCSRSTDWALPGTYQVSAAAIGSEPSAAGLALSVPPRPVVTKTIVPKPTGQPITPRAGTSTAGTPKAGAPKAGTPKAGSTGKPTTPDTGNRRSAD